MLQSRRGSWFVVDPSKTQAHHESPQRHVGAFVVWNLPIGLQRSRSQLEFEVNLRPKFRGNPGFREIPVWRCGGMVAAGERCSWPRPVLSFPQKAVGGWWILPTLLGAGSAWSGSGIRLLSRGRPSSSSARLHCASVLCTSLRQCFGGGCGGQEYGAKDPRVFGGGGGGVGGGL